MNIDMAPTANPVSGPPMTPAVRARNATGFTFGGPPANAILAATLRPVRHAIKVRFLTIKLVAWGFKGRLATARKPYKRSRLINLVGPQR